MPTYTRQEAARALGITKARAGQLVTDREIPLHADRRNGRAVLVMDQAGFDKLKTRTNGRPRKSDATK